MSSVQKAKALPKGQMSPSEWGQPFSLCLLRQNAATSAILQPGVESKTQTHLPPHLRAAAETATCRVLAEQTPGNVPCSY